MAEVDNGFGATLVTTLGTVATTALVVFGADDEVTQQQRPGIFEGSGGVILVVGAAVAALVFLRR